jgi:hypothetical protein
MIVLLLALSALAAGCGASASADPTAPDGADPSGQAPGDGDGGDSDGGDPGGGGDFVTGNGTAHYELSGDVAGSGDLPFVGVTSTFDGNAGQAYLAFSRGGDEVLIVALDRQSGSAVQFGNPDIAISPTPAGCTFDIRQLDDSGASGSFDCQNQFAIKGEQLAVAGITGTFEAHK